MLALLPLVVYASFAAAATVTIKNGTLNGYAHTGLKQELFLNVPYAATTGGENRFLPPKSPSAWDSPRDASAWGNVCPGIGISSTPNASYNQNYVLDEDCLNINIIRPAGTKKGAKLPVLFYIFGGGLTQGAANDPRYNGSYIVERSVKLGKPIIFASINYRLNVLGFPAGKEISDAGSLNLGTKDQRQALKWVHENIDAFGGSPSKVTIWGQSAGGISVVNQLAAFGGKGDGIRNDQLFRAGIVNSGVFASRNATLESQAPSWELFVNTTACAATPTLECLRGLSLADVLAASANASYAPQNVPEPGFMPYPVYQAIEQGKLAQVPLIINVNKDEATSGIGAPVGVATEEILRTAVAAGFKTISAFSDPKTANASIDKLLAVYPNEPSLGCPFDTGPGVLSTGLQDKRAWAIWTDLITSGSRRLAIAHSKKLGKNKVWSSRFQQVPQNGTIEAGVAHLHELPYTFGVLERTPRNPFGNRPADYATSKLIQTYLINFVNDLNPNGKNVPGKLNWPSYSPSSPKNMVYVNNNNKVLPDTYRKAGNDFLQRVMLGWKL